MKNGMDMVKVAILDRIVGSSRYDILITEKECIGGLKTAIPLRLNTYDNIGRTVEGILTASG